MTFVTPFPFSLKFSFVEQKDKSHVFVQLMGEPDIEKFSLDDVCEYAGESYTEDW